MSTPQQTMLNAFALSRDENLAPAAGAGAAAAGAAATLTLADVKNTKDAERVPLFDSFDMKRFYDMSNFLKSKPSIEVLEVLSRRYRDNVSAYEKNEALKVKKCEEELKDIKDRRYAAGAACTPSIGVSMSISRPIEELPGYPQAKEGALVDKQQLDQLEQAKEALKKQNDMTEAARNVEVEKLNIAIAQCKKTVSAFENFNKLYPELSASIVKIETEIKSLREKNLTVFKTKLEVALKAAIKEAADPKEAAKIAPK